MIKKKIQVLIIEDSKLYQRFLQQEIESDDCLAAAGAADSGEMALQLIQKLRPDIITLDMDLPDMDGISLLKEIKKRGDMPVIAVSGDVDACEKAVNAGACDYIVKMQDAEPITAEEFKLLLKLKLKMHAEVRPAAHRSRPQESQKNNRVSAEKRAGFQDRLIAVGASLGGTEATLQIMRQLPGELPGIIIVQHMPSDYTSAYAMRLDRCCEMEVREAKNGDVIRSGTALVAPGGVQLTVRRAGGGYRLSVGGTEKYGGFCPSVDVMFRSVAEAAGKAAMGVILTGMGKDGAEGLKEMHDRGAYTLGQNRESCAVFGMPGAAQSLGAVDRLLPPDGIADEIIRYYSNNKQSEEDRL